MAGQRLVYSYYGTEPPEELLELVRRGEVAGVIFFADNVSRPAANKSILLQAILKLEEANADPRNPIRAPLLLMTDQEGGNVRRLPGEPVLSEKQIGLSDDPAAEAARAGAGAASILSSFRMNVNLAPTLEVYRQPGDFADRYGRSYSSDPEVVAELGADFIRAQQEGGVAATAKHFPGLGAAGATQNTDATPVTLGIPLETLRAIDELPYEAAIAAGVRLVMLSWAIYPALDEAMPAGLSAEIVQNELRGRLGFEGVTITDSLGSTAVLKYGSTRHRARLAVEAGMDLLLCSGQRVSQGQEAFGGLYDRYVDGTLPAEDFRAAVQRIVDLRFSLAGGAGTPPPAAVQYRNTDYGFTFDLPSTWAGYTIVTEEWKGVILQADGTSGPSVSGPEILIRHPKWTPSEPRQDIPIMVFTLSQWEQIQQEGLSVGAAPIPPTELGRNGRYVFALPARYNFAFLTGWEEVETIIEGHPLQPLGG
jgi:beta-N-acetylhexosaminidase